MKYIADTNALLANPEILENYDIVIPSHVNREIEHLELTRKSDKELQFNIRRFKRICDENNNAYTNIKDYSFTLDNELDPQYTDNILLQVAHDEGYGIITNDRLLRRKCRQYNIEFINPKETKDFTDNKGFKRVFMSESDVSDMYQNLDKNIYDLIINEYLVVYDDYSEELVDVLKWTGSYLVSLTDNKGKLGSGFTTEQFGHFKPRDEYQIMAVDSILNNKVTAVRGNAGSGKSMIALNTAWKLVEMEGYKLVILCNPTKALQSAELGFYKGDRLQKLMQTVGTMLKSKFGDEDEVLRQIEIGNLDILPFSDIRGYDTGEEKVIVWFIESQNLTSNLMKLGLQRLGENTKAIVDGDYTAQVDNEAYAISNGMKRMSEVFRGKEVYGEVELQEIYRSEVAKIADEM